MKETLIVYFVVINLLSAAVCGADKIKAVKGARRIRERTLWILSFIGGSPGMYLTMNIIRHKTRHRSFMLGLPALIIFQTFLILMLTNLYARNIIA